MICQKEEKKEEKKEEETEEKKEEQKEKKEEEEEEKKEEKKEGEGKRRRNAKTGFRNCLSQILSLDESTKLSPKYRAI